MVINKKGFKAYWQIILDYTITSLKDFSSYFLLITNAFIIFSFIKYDSKVEDVFFIYLIQSLIIFLFFGIIILSLRKFVSVGKECSGNIFWGTFIFAVFFWLFYGIAHYMLLQPFKSIKIDIGILISIGLFFLTYLISFIIKFKAERERLEKIDLVKAFFEPAIVVMPIYLGIIFGAIAGNFAVYLLFIFKLWADLIANSPLNTQEPFVYKILKTHKEHKTGKPFDLKR